MREDEDRHVVVGVLSKNSSSTLTARWNMDSIPESHYPPRVRRLPGPTILDQNRSCIITLSMPNTTIVSHRPELTHKNIVSCCPSMCLSNGHGGDGYQVDGAGE